MDIKFSSIQVVLFFTVLTLVVDATSAGYRSRGTGRTASRRYNRREIRDYLAPPSQGASYISYGAPSFQPPPLSPYRPGRLLNHPPSTEAPGYFSRFVSWLNPFGGSPTPPPLPEIQLPKYNQLFAPSQAYGHPPSSPPSQSYGPPVPQPPPAGPNGYLPPKVNGKDCHPCDKIPWIPLAGVVQKDADTSGATNVEIQPSIGEEVKNQDDGFSVDFVEEIRTPDFSHGLPSHYSSDGSPLSAPIPYPHLYPGPMPPLFKSKPFNSLPESFHPTPSVELASSDSILTGGGHVEVLPPGAEVDISGDVGEIRDTPPPGYEDGHHGDGYESTIFNAQPSTVVQEDHHSTELTAGYRVQNPSTTSVEVFKSVPAAEYSATVDHPIHYEESPLIDLSEEKQKGPAGGYEDYTAGLNPPPIESAQSYDDSRQSGGSDTSTEAAGEIVKNSYGIPVSQAPPKDSSAASTVTNRTFSYPTPSYGIPDVGGLPISHEATKSNVYESYPPSTEKFLISVSDTTDSSVDLLNDAAQSPNGSTQEQRDGGEQQGVDHREHGRVVDSYQRHIEHTSNGPNQQSGFANTPEPLVPYRPSAVYVPYPPYYDPHMNQNGLSSSESPASTTEEPFLQALLKSYDNFKQEMDAKDQLLRERQNRFKAENQSNQAPKSSGSFGGTTWVSQPQPSFAIPERINPSVYANGKLAPPPASSSETKQQQSGAKKNKQVQIIIPYTSQYTPSPFQPVADDWSGRGPLEQTQGRKVPVLKADDQNYVGQESNKIEVTRPLRPLENLLIKEVAKKPSVTQTNNSIDVQRLQKNIDNWTIQEYSRGITSSTALPSSSHPYLLPSKIIPNEYLNSNQSSVPENRTDANRSSLPGFNYNDLEHEGAASSRVEVPHVQVLTVEGASKSAEYKTKPSTTEATTTTSASPSPSSIISTSSTTTEASWAELPVSISPHNNERVYVVTPESIGLEKSWPKFSDLEEKSGKYEAIERAYQVLPQAVNNLASASVSGPEHSPLWGIMEHDQYARVERENSTTSVPILYSGHSKVSNARPH